jgi:hypothetical protein
VAGGLPAQETLKPSFASEVPHAPLSLAGPGRRAVAGLRAGAVPQARRAGEGLRRGQGSGRHLARDGALLPPNKTPRDPAANGVAHVTITPTRWTFGRLAGDVTYELRIDHAKRPAEIDFLRVGQKVPHGRGLIRREGDVLRIIYDWGARPTAFEGQGSGCDLVLVRESGPR